MGINRRKILSFLITITLFFSILGLTLARTQDFNDFSGEGHSSCHGNITQSATGYITIASSSGTSINPSEIFTVSIQIQSFTEAQGKTIVAGFPSGNPGRGNNQEFTFDAVQQTVSIDSSGNSIILYFQVTAPSIEQSYTLHADAIYRTGGSSSYFAHGDLILTVQVQNTPPQFSSLSESNDPLELGQQEIFQVDVTDSETSVSTVLIEIESINYTMSNILGNTYQYNWTPFTTGIKNYKIYANDTDGSWNSISGSINVIDTSDPIFTNLIESADPLELGQIETIQVNVTDLSGINQVLLEINGGNYSMTNIGDSMWEYDSWTPTSTGLKSYTIYANDNEGNWNSINDSINVLDTVQPSLTSLLESADPLELGQTEIIQINVTDLSDISHVFIEINNLNYTMNKINTDTYQYNNWTPLSIGVKGYIIYANDTEGNWNSLSNSITVQDTTLPSLTNLVESSDPLELGQTEIIQINITDLSGISQVLLEINGGNYSMTNIGGSMWEYNSWTPTSTGLKSYTIYANDNGGNWNSINDSITVQDTSHPSITNLVESADPLELGQTETIQINVTDLSGISQVLLEINGGNYSMTNIGGSMWEYNSWTPISTGLKSYTIYANDNGGNWNSLSSDITVIDTIAPIYSNLIESADPLPLGDNETISIEVYDSPGSGVKDVILEYEGNNHTMAFIGFNTWEWSKWKPTSTGTFNYNIYMIDNSNNLNLTIGAIEVFVSLGPTIQNLSKSANPLELGQIETIQVDVDDTDGVSKVLIEIGGINYTMVNIGGKTYEYSWIPNSIGTKLFKIYANDTLNNWNEIGNGFIVQDTTPPNFSNLTESSDPLELGDFVVISIDVIDLSGINQIKIEYDGINHSMSYFGGNTWTNNTWLPNSVGIHSYTIYIQDNSNNWNMTGGFIDVIDTTAPILSNLYENVDPLELGQNAIIRIDIIDLSPISFVSIEIEGTNYTMSKLDDMSWEFNGWTPNNTGLKFYTIYANDTSNNRISLGANISVIDTNGPTLSNLVESADPLELGQIEIIQINIFDLSEISQVLIEINGVNYTMIKIGGSIWEYNSWTPTTTGLKSYTIYANDVEGNWNSLSNDISTVDTTGPTLSDLVENTDPLELGQIETIQINITDLSSISNVLIEIENANYTMINIGGSIWEYNSWTPTTTGLLSYKIHVSDVEGNWNYLNNSILVRDTVQPLLTNLVESANPLELGQTETIQINVFDLSEINQVLIEIGNVNYTMINIGGISWQYNNWVPNSIGIKFYNIYVMDSSNNWNSISNNITVIDTVAPTLENLIESVDPLEFGNAIEIQVNVIDLSPISLVLIAWENNNNFSMTNLGGITWQDENYTPTSTGLKNYTIYAFDLNNNMVSLKNNITVIDTIGPDISNLVKNPDSIVLGQALSIQVEITDLSGVSEVLIEFDNFNHSLIKIGGNTWEYKNWIPTSIGGVTFIIYAKDNEGNWNSEVESLLVHSSPVTNDPMMTKEIYDYFLISVTIGVSAIGVVLIISTLRQKRFFK